MTGGRHVVFDIVGTCISYDAFFDALEERFGDRLRQHGIPPKLFGLLILEGGERECLFFQLARQPILFMDMIKPIFYRMLAMCGIQKSHDFASGEDVTYVAESYRKLGAREGIHDCMTRLRRAGFTIWALTSGDKARVQSYLTTAAIDLPSENFIACETIGATKPQPEVYEYVLRRLPEGTQPWFAACHMWDSAAAKRSGFRSAWCSGWEKDPMSEVFGDIDIVAHDLPSMADSIILAST
ncbi:haloacid dehalogenase-like hydrolase [Lecanosticta acicola]|uniref:Haloacid dehalogenase-like hydrolase n=1 Tax=Lecanosticta acicola TaxID=111012 RepID=A0AAI9EB08_9PEZI|nr:haloacid dehalogenase-like hydrolase [Lecanosticta acicola]